MAKVTKITLPNGTSYDIGASTANITLRNYELGGTSDLTMLPIVDRARANRLAFLPADQIIIEKTTDGGSTWQDAGCSDGQKIGVFSLVGSNIFIPLKDGKKNTQCGVRLTITGMKYNVPAGTAETDKYNYWNSNYVQSTERYFMLERMWFWVSTNSGKVSVKVESATGANPNSWSTRFDGSNLELSGWSGSDWIKLSASQFGGGTNQTSNTWNWRITFFTKTVGTGYEATNQVINIIKGYGANVWNTGNMMMYHDHLYAYDANQNATFPAKVTATEFSGSLTGNASSATNASKVNNHTVNSDVPANAVFTDTTYTPASANPLMDGTAAVGSSAKYAREDHVHPSDSSRVPTSRTINSKSLASDVTLTASDVGAAPLNSNNKIDNSYLSDRYDYDSTTESIILL